MVAVKAFNGAGDTRTPTVINLIGFWLFQVPFAYIAAMIWEWGPVGIFVAIPLSESLLAIMAIVIFRKGRWKKTPI
ncbi:MAG: hypothetical protein U5L96_20150 [Owenweeksia sp.]|nr:hypothetical protein [Owenweeksia sp.]